MKLWRRERSERGSVTRSSLPSADALRVADPRSEAGFTMVEIAICLAIVAFALVAIIGVLPLGIQVQTDNRQDTIIQHDGMYFLNAIRKGAPADDLPLYVEKVTLTWTNLQQQTLTQVATQFRDSHEIIGLLSNPNVLKVEAIVRALTGAAAEKGDYKNELAFKYKLTAQVRPLESLSPDVGANSQLYWWQTNLAHEVRLVFRYPLTFDEKTGAGKKVFRALVAGRLNKHPTNDWEYFFYREGLTNRGVALTNIFAL